MQPQGTVGEPVVIDPDNFEARRFDTDGSRIIWEEPATEL